MSHRWLIAVSMGAHLAVAGGLFVAGIWRIERMEDHNRSRAEILQPAPPPAPSGGPVAAKLPDIKPKDRPPHVAKGPVQPTSTPKPPIAEPESDGGGNPGPDGPGDSDAPGTCTENCGEGPHTAPVCGDGSRDASEECDDGNTVNGDGCSSTCRIEVKPKPPAAQVAPNVLSGLRISGETQLHPSSLTQSMMIHDGASRVVGTIKLCISTEGGVTSAAMLGSTRYKDYDATLLSAVRAWRYRPYTLNGAPIPACSSVTFIYTIQ